MRQFELWWADLPKPAGRRPVLLLSRDDAYSYLHKLIAAEVTTTMRAIPVEVPDDLRTVSRGNRSKSGSQSCRPAASPK